MLLLKFINHTDDQILQIYDKITDMFYPYHCSGNEIKEIINMILQIPYCIDGKRYVYGTNFYDDISELPASALDQLIYKAECLH